MIFALFNSPIEILDVARLICMYVTDGEQQASLPFYVLLFPLAERLNIFLFLSQNTRLSHKDIQFSIRLSNKYEKAWDDTFL